MVKLSVPYRSQWDEDATTHDADCGPTCLAMILNFFDVSITPDAVYGFLSHKDKGDFTSIQELISIFSHHGVTAKRRQFSDQTTALNQLRANIDAGHPMIALVKYQPWIEATGIDYKWGHFVVVTGYDDTHITMHDPLFGLWVLRSKGAHFTMPNDLFAAGWGGFPTGENPNWVCVVAGETAVTPPVVTPPSPQPPPPTPQPPISQPPAPPVNPPPPPANIMADEMRRINALAAYRWAEPPVLEADMQLWRSHLGDFGQTYDEYTVQPGNSLAQLATRFYGQQHRWPAIKAYNNLKQESLWVGQKLLIPHLGQSGAYKDAGLPSDTLNVPKALSPDDLVNPDSEAMDYNSFGKNSVGIGFTDENA